MVLKRSFSTCRIMSHSKFEYVKKFEQDDRLLPNTWIVVRIDGKSFHRFSDVHKFQKPNDFRSLDLMNYCANEVMKEFNDVVLSYGQSDEYSFVFRKNTDLYGRRSAKIMTNVVTLFSSSYVFNWSQFFPDVKMEYPPAFDARTVLYPSDKNIRDYLSWRQADCHINNLYNTVFWSLVLKGGMGNREAQERLKGTFSNDKNEILFSQFNINYNNEPQQVRKGTTIYKKKVKIPVEGNEANVKIRSSLVTENIDIIGDAFWNENPHILGAEVKEKS